MLRRMFAIATLCAMAVVFTGCAGPTKMAEKSQQKLASGDMWRAWQLATRALDREPLNPSARDAAAAAGAAISDDWQRRIAALAAVDSMRAAEQALEFVNFRGNAAHYTTLAVTPAWSDAERALRRSAARRNYVAGREAMSAMRPKLAYDRFMECGRFEDPWRDAAKLADAAYEKALTRVAVMPVTCAWGDVGVGQDVADHWRDAAMHEVAAPQARFTRVLGADAIDSRMTVAQLAHLSRADAVKLARKAGAQRVVLGSLGPVKSETNLQYFREHVARRIVQKNAAGETETRWVEVPIEVVARVRDVDFEIDHEIVSTKDGSTLAHQRTPLHKRARVVWTSYVPEGELDRYALVSEVLRAADPERAKAIETRWKAACGDETTLQQVLTASREARATRATQDARGTLARFALGTAFVFLQELPGAPELARIAAQSAWQPLVNDLARLDGIDDVDLGVAASDDLR